jgi:hypothetical protein
MESWKLKRMCEKKPDELKVRLQKRPGSIGKLANREITPEKSEGCARYLSRGGDSLPHHQTVG